MNVESLAPFLLVLAPFALAFFLEALVIYFFKFHTFWASAGIAFLINGIALAVLYGAVLITGKMGYVFNGLQLPLPVIFFLWWVSVIADSILLRLFSKKPASRQVVLAALLMNTLSYLFLYFFIINTH